MRINKLTISVLKKKKTRNKIILIESYKSTVALTVLTATQEFNS